MSLPLWLVHLPFRCQHSPLDNCPSPRLCLCFSLIVKVQLYRCVYYIRENPVSKYVPVYKYRVGVNLRYLTHYTVGYAFVSHLTPSTKLWLNSWVWRVPWKRDGGGGWTALVHTDDGRFAEIFSPYSRFHLPFSLPFSFQRYGVNW